MGFKVNRYLLDVNKQSNLRTIIETNQRLFKAINIVKT